MCVLSSNLLSTPVCTFRYNLGTLAGVTRQEAGQYRTFLLSIVFMYRSAKCQKKNRVTVARVFSTETARLDFLETSRACTLLCFYLSVCLSVCPS